MRTELQLDILPQPDETSCGPTCLHALYRYYGSDISLEQVVREVSMLEEGGTLAVWLACDALRRGFSATIYTYKLQLFDPTWLIPGGPDLREKLRAQMLFKKNDPKLVAASRAYIEFIDLGGLLCFEDLTPGLIRRHLKQSIPVLTGLSATYLYRSAREFGFEGDFDDIRGEPAGHFVVLAGYDRGRRTVLLADPLHSNPVSEGRLYEMNIHRVICSILLGVLTYDANLLVIRPPKKKKDRLHADAHRR